MNKKSKIEYKWTFSKLINKTTNNGILEKMRKGKEERHIEKFLYDINQSELIYELEERKVESE